MKKEKLKKILMKLEKKYRNKDGALFRVENFKVRGRNALGLL